MINWDAQEPLLKFESNIIESRINHVIYPNGCHVTDWSLTWSIMKINFYLEELISRTILKMKILNKPSASTIFYGFKIFWADDSTLKIVKFRFFKSETSWSSGWTNFKSLEVLNFDAFKIDTFQKSDRYHSKSVVNRSELVLKTSRFKILLRYVSLKKC